MLISQHTLNNTTLESNLQGATQNFWEFGYTGQTISTTNLRR